MSEMAGGMAMIIFGLLIIIVLLRVLVLVHRQTAKMEEMKSQLKMTQQARERKEKK